MLLCNNIYDMLLVPKLQPDCNSLFHRILHRVDSLSDFRQSLAGMIGRRSGRWAVADQSLGLGPGATEDSIAALIGSNNACRVGSRIPVAVSLNGSCGDARKLGPPRSCHRTPAKAEQISWRWP